MSGVEGRSAAYNIAGIGDGGGEGGSGNGTRESRQFPPPSPGENTIMILMNTHINEHANFREEETKLYGEYRPQQISGRTHS